MALEFAATATQHFPSQHQQSAYPYQYQYNDLYHSQVQQSTRQTSQSHAQPPQQSQGLPPTPQSSVSSTPSTNSPTSPQPSTVTTTATDTTSTGPATMLPPYLGFQSRQLRPARSPLYTPAVLRPTEHFTPASSSEQGLRRHARGAKSTSAVSITQIAPLTPSVSASGSLEGGGVAERGSQAGIETEETDLAHEQGRAVSEQGHMREVSWQATADSTGGAGQRGGSWIGDYLPGRIARIVIDEWNDRGLEEGVTGLPTRDHWKPDNTSPSCEFPPCAQPFTLTARRHHCRRCGRIFCAPHSRHLVPLDQLARFHPSGRRVRACDSCWADYGWWEPARAAKVARRRPLGEEAVVDEEGSGTSGSVTPVPGTEEEEGGGTGKKKTQVQMLVGSVPRDWSWSTF